MFLARDDLIPDALDDIFHVDDGIYRNAVLFIDRLHSGLFALQRTLHPVYGDDHAGDVYICCAFQLGIYLSHCLAGSHNVLDDDHLFAVCQLFADEHTAFAVVLDFLAVKAEVYVLLVLVRQSHSCCGCQRNTLVRRTENGLYRDVMLCDAGSVIASQLHQLCAAVIVAGVDEIRCFSAAFQRKLAECQHAAVYHKAQE